MSSTRQDSAEHLAALIKAAEHQRRTQLAIINYLRSRGSSAENSMAKLAAVDDLLGELRERLQHLLAGETKH